MNDYYIRAIESDWPQVIELGGLLGAVPNPGWVYIGPLYEPTGQTRTDAQGDVVPLVQPIKDGNGNVYLHANLRIDFDLGDRARELAMQHPEMAEALQNLGKYFLLDADGKPRSPTNPKVVFF